MEKYSSIQQLMKKEEGKEKVPLFPPTVIQAVFDAKTGASLESILAQYNNLYVQYQGSVKDTRLIIPMQMRRAGLTITYTNMDSETITERASSAVQKDNDHWALDTNWTRVDELSLSGEIAVSTQGTWIINGEDTGIKAVGPKGDAGLTPWLKTIENRLHFSYDNTTWEPCSGPIDAYFRWKDNKIQISRNDGRTWTDLSGEFADNFRIKGYVSTKSDLPFVAMQGDIYGVGPTYAEDDTEKSNPIYRFYVRNANTWVDNGPFTSIAAGIVQETGNSENAVMSQKAVTDKLSELGSEVRGKATKAELQAEISRVESTESELGSKIISETNRATAEERRLDNVKLNKSEIEGYKTEIYSKVASQDDVIDGFKEAITEQVNNYRPIEINGNVTNAADEEDITSENGLLKLKDRSALNGMGHVILRKNKTFAEQVTLQNTIYEIRYDFDLNGEEITIPEGCVLDFQGGSLYNGTIIGEPLVEASQYCIFNNVIAPDLNNDKVSIEWFGGYAYKYWEDVSEAAYKNNDVAVKNAMVSIKPREITFTNGYYRFINTIEIRNKQITFSGDLADQTYYAIRRKTNNDALTSQLYFSTENSVFIKSYTTKFAIKNLCLHGNKESIAIELCENATGVLMDCVQFWVWKGGIYKTKWDGIVRDGFNRNVYNKVAFAEIKQGCIYITYDKGLEEKEMYYITNNHFTNCAFTRCGFGVHLESNSAIVMNYFVSCNFAFIGYGSNYYKLDDYGEIGCFGIKITSNVKGTSIGGNKCVNCYFENIFPYREGEDIDFDNEIILSNNYIAPKNDYNYSSTIVYNSNINYDCCYFTNCLKFFTIDQNTSINIGDVRLFYATSHFRVDTYKYKRLVVVNHNNDIDNYPKNGRNIISYNNSWALAKGHYLIGLCSFDVYNDRDKYVIENKYEYFEDVNPYIKHRSSDILSQSVVNKNSVTLKCVEEQTSYTPLHLEVNVYFGTRTNNYRIIIDNSKAEGLCVLTTDGYTNLGSPEILYKKTSDTTFYLKITVSGVRINYIKYNNGITGSINEVSDDIDFSDAIDIPICRTLGAADKRPTDLPSSFSGFHFWNATDKRPSFWWSNRWVDIDGYSYNKKTGNTNDRPILLSDETGYVYFDSTLKKPIWWTGTKWVDATGNEV